MSRILVVDDEEPLRTLVARGLTMDGHTCLTAADGAEALDLLIAENGHFDLLLTDIRMPLMDGIALALAAKQAFPDLTIMLMTGYAEQRERAGGLDAIVEEVMTKPFTIEIGLEKIRSEPYERSKRCDGRCNQEQQRHNSGKARKRTIGSEESEGPADVEQKLEVVDKQRAPAAGRPSRDTQNAEDGQRHQRVKRGPDRRKDPVRWIEGRLGEPGIPTCDLRDRGRAAQQRCGDDR